MNVRGNIHSLSKSIDNDYLLTIKSKQDLRGLYDTYINRDLEIDIKIYKEKRSLNANALLWKLINDISVVIGSSSDEVYRVFIRRVGKATIVPIKHENIKDWITGWERNGKGWFCETLGDSKHEGYTNIINYHGSSLYNTQEFSRLLSEVVDECKELGIDTDPEHIKQLLNKH